MSSKKKISQIKSSSFSRGFSLAKLSLNAGLQYASSKITNSPIEDFFNLQAIQIAREFGQLKGSIMKAGQMLSMYGEHFLPPEANKILKTLQSDSVALDWNSLKDHLASSLDGALLDELEIDPNSLGSASMGQVHLAIIKSTGQKIALKIQYPGVEKAIDSDISALKKILSVTKILPSGLDLTEVFKEIKVMLHQELDYTHEAQQTLHYHELLSNDSRYIVPRVFSRYSNGKVLATEYIEGLKADHDLVQALSQDRRNRLSENFIELYFREIFDWNFVQTDPHLGNYKIQIDSRGKDRLVLLDFGACKKFNTDFMANYQKMIKGAILRNEALFLQGAADLGFIKPGDEANYIKAFTDFCYETVEPFGSEELTYNWKKNDLPGRVVKKALQFKNFKLRTPPKEILFLDRKTGGVFIFLSVLGADINARKIIAPFLNKA